MKLKKLNIQSYRHLQEVEFDFTYPEGHAKAGEPLEKICIIGQSATGKTGVLELLKNTFEQLRLADLVDGSVFKPSFRLPFQGIIESLYQGERFHASNKKIIYKDRRIETPEISLTGTLSHLFDEGFRLLYLSADIISPKAISFFNENPIDLIKLFSDKYIASAPDKSKQHVYIYEFKYAIDEELWFSLLYKILDYRKRFTQMASELINKGVIGDMQKLNKEYEKWSMENINPLVAFAEYFNPILNKLNLEVDLVNTEYSIPIKSKIKDEVIPISALSTGTKGLLLSLFPLFELNTDDALILIDEPERSLFPDMQIELMQHYQRMAPNAQFVVATHSPFIAAAFEPEERFILYFDEKGKVAVRRGESPIGDDPNDILQNDFKVDYYNEFGKKAYRDYLALKSKIAQTDAQEEKEKLIVELAQLGDKYNF